VRSVEDDSTFIVFHTGNYERIGFRHRRTRTLVLSELIDIRKCTDPAYGKMQIGLFISIIEDVLDRTRQRLEIEQAAKPERKSHKRGLPTSDPLCGAKRPRTRGQITKDAAMKRERRLRQKASFEVLA
jgi:hypothetical protein